MKEGAFWWKGTEVRSPLGVRIPDTEGSPVGVARVDPNKSYVGVPELLRQVIDQGDRHAWDRIKGKIDETSVHIGLAMEALLEETRFGKTVEEDLAAGKKLLFKPNLVNPLNIDAGTHGQGRGAAACTQWPFLAALMRWFHDKIGVRYHQMALGEASTTVTAFARMLSMSNPHGTLVMPEALIEGKSGDFYGGWGFYFVRKYLSECPGVRPDDDPMRGHDRSVKGVYAPPGRITDELVVYDLNRILDDPSRGRELNVPEGVNFKKITLHKAVVGGDPEDPQDIRDYPGCILVNVPKLKVHNYALFTNVIKNLGIGLYPMQFTCSGDHRWEYSNPQREIPGMKGGIPHEVWVAEMDPETCLPRMDERGEPFVKKTGGLTATMIDSMKVLMGQGVFMIHVVDAVEVTNLDHQGSDFGETRPEGMIFAGLDPVATDLLCARYMFSNVPLTEALEAGVEDGIGGRFPQAVPVPVVEDGNIVTSMGYDCPLLRDDCLEHAELRGLGVRKYHVTGWDGVAGGPFISLEGHPGNVRNGTFHHVCTDALYYDIYKFPWDLQETALSYLSASDQLTGSSFKKAFSETFGKNGLRYGQMGKKGIGGIMLHLGGRLVSELASDPYGPLRAPAVLQLKFLRLSHPSRNRQGLDLLQEFSLGSACLVALRMSQMEMESPDPFAPGLSWGQGKWPSIHLAQFVFLGMSLYGEAFPNQLGYPGLYASALLYADLTQEGGRLLGASPEDAGSDGFNRYVSGVRSGTAKALDFTFYVPPGYENLGGSPVPNVEATGDPERVLTVWFKGGEEVWGRLGPDRCADRTSPVAK